MSRATRIYIAIDIDGTPVVARTVKHEMRLTLLTMSQDILDGLSFWSVPDGIRHEIKMVDLDFFLKS